MQRPRGGRPDSVRRAIVVYNRAILLFTTDSEAVRRDHPMCRPPGGPPTPPPTAELGFELDYEDTLREFSGGSMSTRLQVTQQRLRWSVPLEFVDNFNRRLSEAMRRDLRPVEGVAEALAQLRTPCCVASNGPHE